MKLHRIYFVEMWGNYIWWWLGGQSFHNFTMHALCKSLHLHTITSVNSPKTGQKSRLPLQTINEASVLASHSAAGKIAISRASDHAEPLERFQSVGITNVVGVKDAASDPHNMTGSIFIFHFSFMQVKQMLSCGKCVVKQGTFSKNSRSTRWRRTRRYQSLNNITEWGHILF